MIVRFLCPAEESYALLVCVLDADEVDGLACLAGLMEGLLREGVPTLLEASRRGGHMWVHMVEPTPAQVVWAWLLPYAVTCRVELYP